jgi:hypothetical protein
MRTLDLGCNVDMPNDVLASLSKLLLDASSLNAIKNSHHLLNYTGPWILEKAHRNSTHHIWNLLGINGLGSDSNLSDSARLKIIHYYDGFTLESLVEDVVGLPTEKLIPLVMA